MRAPLYIENSSRANLFGRATSHCLGRTSASWANPFDPEPCSQYVETFPFSAPLPGNYLWWRATLQALRRLLHRNRTSSWANPFFLMARLPSVSSRSPLNTSSTSGKPGCDKSGKPHVLGNPHFLGPTSVSHLFDRTRHVRHLIVTCPACLICWAHLFSGTLWRVTRQLFDRDILCPLLFPRDMLD